MDKRPHKTEHVQGGMLGDVYMAAIRPFRYLFVYPPMLRELAYEYGSVNRRKAA